MSFFQDVFNIYIIQDYFTGSQQTTQGKSPQEENENERARAVRQLPAHVQLHVPAPPIKRKRVGTGAYNWGLLQC